MVELEIGFVIIYQIDFCAVGRDVIQQIGCGLVHSRVDEHHAAGKLCRIDLSDIPGLSGVFAEEIAVIERRIVFQLAELFIQVKAGGVLFFCVVPFMEIFPIGVEPKLLDGKLARSIVDEGVEALKQLLLIERQRIERISPPPRNGPDGGVPPRFRPSPDKGACNM